MKDQFLLSPTSDFIHIILGKKWDEISTVWHECKKCDVRNFHREDAWGQAAEDIPLGHQPGCPVSPLQPPPKRFSSGRYTENVHQSLSGDSPQSLLSASKLETQRLSCCKKWVNYLDKPNPSFPLQQSAPTLPAQCVQKWCKYLIKEISLENFYDLLVS